MLIGCALQLRQLSPDASQHGVHFAPIRLAQVAPPAAELLGKRLALDSEMRLYDFLERCRGRPQLPQYGVLQRVEPNLLIVLLNLMEVTRYGNVNVRLMPKI